MQKGAKFAAAAAVLLALLALFLLLQPEGNHREPLPTSTESAFSSPEPVPEGTTPPVETAPQEDDLPYDKLFITVERQRYSDGDLTLRIPALDVEEPILNGVDAATLKRGVGLYDYAQLPGEGNRNVSLAGHRNGLKNGKVTDDRPFYYIDTLNEGDYLYLTDSDWIYQYQWESAEVVEPDDWGPIYSQGYPCLTLTTCTPIGISDHRLIVRGRLTAVLPRTEDYRYPDRTAEKEGTHHESKT